MKDSLTISEQDSILIFLLWVERLLDAHGEIPHLVSCEGFLLREATPSDKDHPLAFSVMVPGQNPCPGC